MLRRLPVTLALSLLALVLATAAAAAPGQIRLKVKTISLSYRASMTATGAAGTVTATVKADLAGVGKGTAAVVDLTKGANVYACNPGDAAGDCPHYVVGGTVTVEETLTPADASQPATTCKRTVTYKRGVKAVNTPIQFAALVHTAGTRYGVLVEFLPELESLYRGARDPDCAFAPQLFDERGVTTKGSTTKAALQKATSSSTLAGAPQLEVVGGTGTLKLTGKVGFQLVG